MADIVNAIKNGVTGVFSKRAWDSLPAGKYGWKENTATKEETNLKIIEFINEKPKVPATPVMLEDKLPDILETKKKEVNAGDVVKEGDSLSKLSKKAILEKYPNLDSTKTKKQLIQEINDNQK